MKDGKIFHRPGGSGGPESPPGVAGGGLDPARIGPAVSGWETGKAGRERRRLERREQYKSYARFNPVMEENMVKREAQFYSVADLAAILGVHNSTIREQAAAGHLPAIRIGRLWRFPKHKIDSWLEKGNPPGSPAEAGAAEGSSAVDAKTREWMEADLMEPLPPYNWGDVDPLTLGNPVSYVPGVGLVIEEREDQK